MNNGGDVLARGFKSAQFAAGGGDLSDFEYDLRTREEVVAEKYGLSAAEIATYKTRVDAGERVALDPVDLLKEMAGITVIDKRSAFLASEAVKEAEKNPPKYPEKKYGKFSPILDRILVKRCTDSTDEKIMEDGSVVNTKTGLITAAKYRQHSNIGIVLATGKFVIIGGQRIPMEEVVRIGDKVTYGDYNSEVFHMDEKRVQDLCDAVQMNYDVDPEGLRVVRVQDVRGVERPEEFYSPKELSVGWSTIQVQEVTNG
jgi:co-chaperonin GroES (HSP10)